MDLQRLIRSQRISRRNLLLATGSMASIAIANQVIANPKYQDYPFTLGVASGEPLPNSVVLWTRLAPNPNLGVSMPPINVPVQWQVAKDKKMAQIIARGEVIATPELAHSVRVVVDRLEPNTWYWYQFKTGSEVSEIGRTRTLPDFKDRATKLAFAFVSCQNYEHGYFNAYRHLAAEELDFVIHLGDYIYEPANNPKRNQVRKHPSREATDLDSYREFYSLYKSDRDLQAAHAAFPFICTWDDHEVDNDYADLESQDFDRPEDFLLRRAAAYQAYYEHLPLRPLSRPQNGKMQIYRSFNWGNLASFYLLDNRQYRSDQPCDENGRGGGQLITNCQARFDRDRTLLGAKQERWLFDSLANSNTIWNVISQQTLVAQLKQKLNGVTSYWSDGWDAYPVARQRILDFIAENKIENPVFIGGDIHSFWVTDLKADFNNINCNCSINVGKLNQKQGGSNKNRRKLLHKGKKYA
ncbi:MAG: alkaline phosphatase D family protein [Prochloraceae cyanobacterium]|nr:alkaline phosphatase D family protein [Prochloraceae cyanobacterium]